MPKPILVVDDAHGNLAELIEALRQAGYAPVTLAAGDDPVLRFGVVQPELVFISLDEADPSTLCEGIRSDPDGAIVPIVLVGKDHPEVRSPSDALGKGADYYFARPFEMKKVLAKVQTYIGKGEGGAATAKTAEKPKPVSAEKSGIKAAPAKPADKGDKKLGTAVPSKMPLGGSAAGAGSKFTPVSVPRFMSNDPAPAPAPTAKPAEYEEESTTPGIPSPLLGRQDLGAPAAATLAEIDADDDGEAERLAEERELAAKLEAEAKARAEREAEERLEAERAAAEKAEEKARKEAEEKARTEAEEKAQTEAAEQAEREAEERARQEIEEIARRQAEEAHREAEEQMRLAIEERPRQDAEIQARQLALEAEATRRAEEEAEERRQEEARRAQAEAEAQQ